MERFAQNPSELLRIVNMVVGGLLIAGGVGSLINHSFSSIIIGIYEVIAGALTIILEIRQPTEHQKQIIHTYASFMHSFLGRGVAYLLFGILLLNYYLIVQICGSLAALVGVTYIAFHFLRPFDPPSTMQAPSTDPEAQPVWQAPTE